MRLTSSHTLSYHHYSYRKNILSTFCYDRLETWSSYLLNFKNFFELQLFRIFDTNLYIFSKMQDCSATFTLLYYYPLFLSNFSYSEENDAMFSFLSFMLVNIIHLHLFLVHGEFLYLYKGKILKKKLVIRQLLQLPTSFFYVPQ